jgi:hypothetical protein
MHIESVNTPNVPHLHVALFEVVHGNPSVVVDPHRPLTANPGETLVDFLDFEPEPGDERVKVPQLTAQDGMIALSGLFYVTEQRAKLNVDIRDRRASFEVDEKHVQNLRAVDTANKSIRIRSARNGTYALTTRTPGLYRLHKLRVPGQDNYYRGIVRHTGRVERGESTTVDEYYRGEVRVAARIIGGPAQREPRD